jgi:hypothetical protein
VIDSDRPAMTRATRAETMPSPRAARAYRAVLLDHGFIDVTVEVHTVVVTDARLLSMLTGLADLAPPPTPMRPTRCGSPPGWPCRRPGKWRW